MSVKMYYSDLYQAYAREVNRIVNFPGGLLTRTYLIASEFDTQRKSVSPRQYFRSARSLEHLECA